MPHLLKFYFIVIFVLVEHISNAQTFPAYNKMDSAATSDARWSAWLQDLYQPGILKEKDSIILNDEAKRIIADTNFRKLIYPPTYTVEAAHYLMQRMENKKAIWYFMNLFTQDTANRLLVVNSLLPFDQVIEMDKAIISAFYTYALLDPRFCEIKNGVPIVRRPDLLEGEFNRIKELIAYIQFYRQARSNKK